MYVLWCDAACKLSCGDGYNFLAAAQLGGFYRVAHQHGDGERSDSSRHRRDCSCNFCDIGINVSYQRRTSLGECRLTLGVAGEELREFVGVADLVHADIDYSSARLNVVGGDDARP